MTLAFDVTVAAVQQLSPNFRRITFGGYSLRDFGVHGETLDLRVKLMIPSLAEDGTQLPLPVFQMEQSGWYQEWLAMDPATRGSMRTYTVRQERLDAVYPEIDVDFVLHFDAAGNGGPAANWALTRQARGRPHHHRTQQPGRALCHGGDLLRHRMAARPGPAGTACRRRDRCSGHQRHPGKPPVLHERACVP